MGERGLGERGLGERGQSEGGLGERGRSASRWWARSVVARWRSILFAWLVVTILVRVFSPAWDEIAYDGDFEYLPAAMPSVAGGRLLDRAFPRERSRSQIVFVLRRGEGPLRGDDEIVGLDLMRRLYHRLAEVSWQRAIDAGYDGGEVEEGEAAARWLRLTREALDQSIASDARFYEALGERVPEASPTPTEPRMAIAYWDRAKLGEQLGDPSEEIAGDFEAALVLDPDLPEVVAPIEARSTDGFDPLIDVLSWDDRVIGKRLRTESARMAVLQLSSELAATGNIETVEAAESLSREVWEYSGRFVDPGLELVMTGSAAIGGETLIAARDAIRYTELFTVLMVLAILVAVYRAPLLVLIPLVSIGVAVVVSGGLVAWLARWSIEGTIPWLDMRVFTTSRIFVVVILFGAGTDYCLFLIARLREEAWRAGWEEACRRALAGVTGALLGSALTTIVGLSMLWIADFGKFHYTGPIIAICLAVGLLICTTLTPALLRAAGPRVFWPGAIPDPSRGGPALFAIGDETGGRGSGLWSRIAILLTRRPVLGLSLGLVILAIPAVYGFRHEDKVTYDLSSELDPSAPSRYGLEVFSEHFPIGEVSPVTVLLLREDSVPASELETMVKRIRRLLYSVRGVVGGSHRRRPARGISSGSRDGVIAGRRMASSCVAESPCRTAAFLFRLARVPGPDDTIGRGDRGGPVFDRGGGGGVAGPGIGPPASGPIGRGLGGDSGVVRRDDTLDHGFAGGHAFGQPADQVGGHRVGVPGAGAGDSAGRVVHLPDRDGVDQLLRDARVDDSVFSNVAGS